MTIMKFGAAFLAALALLCACSGSQADTSQADANAILKQMHATCDRPQSPLDAWITLLCAGDGIRSAEGLAEAGAPSAQAEALSAILAEAERRVSSERLAVMSTFAGIVRMHPEGGRHDAKR